MRRVPVDEEFGTPIAALRNSPTVLFENGTIAKINDSKDEKNPLMFKHYSFYYENVSQITHLKLNSKDEISKFGETYWPQDHLISVQYLLKYAFSAKKNALILFLMDRKG